MSLATFATRVRTLLIAANFFFIAAPCSVFAQSNDLMTLQQRVFQANQSGRFQEALRLSEQALALAERSFGPRSPAVAQAHLSIAVQLQSLGNLPAAEEHYRKGLATQESAARPDDPSLGMFVSGLGGLLYGQGRYEDAEPYMRRSLEIQEQVAKATGNEGSLAIALFMLGSNHTLMGRLEDGRGLLERSLTLFERLQPSGGLQTAIVLNNLATNRQKANDLAGAIAHQGRALDLFERHAPTNLPAIAKNTHNFAYLLRQQGQVQKAAEQYTKAIGLFRRAYPDGHPEIATAEGNLGALLRDVGALKEAEPLLASALATRVRRLPADHPDIAEAHNQMADLWIRRGDWARAVTALDAAAEIYVARARRQTDSRGTALRDDIARNRLVFGKLVKALHRHAPNDVGRAFLAAQYAIDSAAAASVAQMASRHAGGDSALAAVVRTRQDAVAEWTRVDKDLVASLADPAASAAPADSVRSKLVALDTRIRDLDNRITAEFPQYAALARPAPLPLDAAAANLAADEALILFLDTAAFPAMPEEMFVFVVTKTERRWFRLDVGPTFIAREVAALRCGLDYLGAWDIADSRCGELTGSTYTANDNALGRPLPFDAQRAHALYRALLGQAEALIAGRRLLVVPSGALTKLPLHVLVTRPPENQHPGRTTAWLARTYALAVFPAVSSLFALRHNAKASRATRPYIGIANPLLDGPDERWSRLRAAARERTSCGRSQQVAAADTRSPGARAPALRSGVADVAELRRASPLPETADEVCDVAGLLGAAETDVLLAARSTEHEVRRLSVEGRLGDYRTVHFATHGAVAGEVEGSSEPGLFLTPPPPGHPVSADDDGYLAASEILELRLDADWVILSACNTAAGEASGGEALSGLARAFFYAGARTLLVSHWYVDSVSTVALIKGAVAELGADPTLGPSEAMRRAMLALLGGTEERYWHPAYWAPFVVVGESGVKKS